MTAFDFTRLLGSGLDRATEADLEEAATEVRQQIANGNTDADGFLEQIECRLNWKRRCREDRESIERQVRDGLITQDEAARLLAVLS